MKKILIFKNGIFDIMLEKGVENIESIDIKQILEEILDTRIMSIELKTLIEKGIDKKTAMIMCLTYELGRKHFFSFSHKKL